MLNFRNTNIAFIVLLTAAIWLDVNRGIPWYAYAVLVFIYSLVVFYGCYFIQASFFLPIVCNLKTTTKVIAISFDDGPASNYTLQFLQILKDHHTQAAFFCIGNRIAGNEAVLQQLHNDGHIIGNHSFSHHFWFDMFSSKKMLADLRQMDAAVQHATGLQPKLFRPPYGVTNPNLKKAIIKGGYTPVGWSVRSLDTVIKDEQKLLDKLKAKLNPGAVYLFHDTSKTTLHVLPAFLTYAKQQGYQIVRPDKMLHLQAYA